MYKGWKNCRPFDHMNVVLENFDILVTCLLVQNLRMSQTVFSGSSSSAGMDSKKKDEHVCSCILTACVGVTFFLIPGWSILLQPMFELAACLQQFSNGCQELLDIHVPSPTSSCFLWECNLTQCLLTWLAFCIPIRDLSPWQTNEFVLRVWCCQTAWRKQF